ncbi:DMT family transporter [Oleiharenicola lentus]|uniref:DMT family transporter n=2 Tax=Oleiharenicola lentus TaxID=2508720 RepID=A0A4Q1C7N8_9BACT|nr:DMT family transporter [Oleiharenicola lentus]
MAKLMMNSSGPLHRRAILGLLIANLLWGLSFPLIKAMGQEQLQLVPASSSWFITTLTVASRFVLATAVMLLLARAQLAELKAGELRQGVWLGLTLGAGLLLQVDGLQFTSASTSAFLTQFYAIMIPAVVALRARRSPPPVVWACAALVLAGVAILGRFDWRALHLGRGEMETLLSSVFFMVQIFVLEDARYAGNRALAVTAVMFTTVAVVFGGLALVTAPTPADCLRPWTSGSWLAFLGLLTLFCTLGSFTLMVRWQPHITATEAGLIYCIEPVFASVMALFLPALFSRWAGFDYANESLTWQLLAGGGLITLANVLLQLKPPARRTA